MFWIGGKDPKYRVVHICVEDSLLFILPNIILKKMYCLVIDLFLLISYTILILIADLEKL